MKQADAINNCYIVIIEYCNYFSLTPSFYGMLLGRWEGVSKWVLLYAFENAMDDPCGSLKMLS